MASGSKRPTTGRSGSALPRINFDTCSVANRGSVTALHTRHIYWARVTRPHAQDALAPEKESSSRGAFPRSGPGCPVLIADGPGMACAIRSITGAGKFHPFP